MKNKMEKCTEQARITLPWGGKLLNYCPVHANQIVKLGNAMGSPVQAQLIPITAVMECESHTPLTDEEKELAKEFKL
jgi:hypothetical protein